MQPESRRAGKLALSSEDWTTSSMGMVTRVMGPLTRGLMSESVSVSPGRLEFYHQPSGMGRTLQLAFPPGLFLGSTVVTSLWVQEWDFFAGQLILHSAA